MADEKEKQKRAPKSEKQPQPKAAKGAPREQAAAKAKGEPKPKAEAARPPEPKVPARLRLKYESEIVPLLMRELKIENRWRVPRLEKIVVNMGVSEARENVKVLDSAVEEIGALTGQKPVITRSRKAISNFKLRKGMPIGAMVTLRRERMWEFFDRLVNVALARVRDFRGVSDKAFDGRGNYSLGIREHTIFPEVSLDKVELVKGLTVSIVTTARSDFEGTMLLQALGMPFRGASGERAGFAAAASGAAGKAAGPASAQGA